MKSISENIVSSIIMLKCTIWYLTVIFKLKIHCIKYSINVSKTSATTLFYHILWINSI